MWRSLDFIITGRVNGIFVYVYNGARIWTKRNGIFSNCSTCKHTNLETTDGFGCGSEFLSIIGLGKSLKGLCALLYGASELNGFSPQASHLTEVVLV